MGRKNSGHGSGFPEQFLFSYSKRLDLAWGQLLHPQFLHLLGSNSHGFRVGRNAATQFKALYSPQEPVLMNELGYTPCNGD